MTFGDTHTQTGHALNLGFIMYEYCFLCVFVVIVGNKSRGITFATLVHDVQLYMLLVLYTKCVITVMFEYVILQTIYINI